MQGESCSGFRLHLVESFRELALLASSSILVNDVASSSLVDLLNSSLVGCLSKLGITGSESSLILLDIGLHLRAEDLVLKGLRFSCLNALLCTFNVRHSFHLR